MFIGYNIIYIAFPLAVTKSNLLEKFIDQKNIL